MVRSLRLLHFRCFETLDLTIDSPRCVFVGQNAQGKTSLLEALCVLIRLHSPRAKKFAYLIQDGQEHFGVAGDCWGVSRRVDYGKGMQTYSIEGEAVRSQNEYLGAGGLLVWMASEDLNLVKGAAEKRRHFLDFVCSQVDLRYRRARTRYRYALKGRNSFLKKQDREGVAAYTEVLVTEAVILSAIRAEVVQRLAPFVLAAQQTMSGRRDEAEETRFHYKQMSEDQFREQLAEEAAREWRLGQTLVGPHREELFIGRGGRPAAQYMSEGQLRTLVLAMKLGQGALLKAHGQSRPRELRAPLFLVDDVFGELDEQRRNVLLDFLAEEEQVLITTTGLSWMQPSVAPAWSVYEVTKGTVQKKK